MKYKDFFYTKGAVSLLVLTLTLFIVIILGYLVSHSIETTYEQSFQWLAIFVIYVLCDVVVTISSLILAILGLKHDVNKLTAKLAFVPILMQIIFFIFAFSSVSGVGSSKVYLP